MKSGCLPLVVAMSFAVLVTAPSEAATASPDLEPSCRFDEVFADGARICFLGDSITAGAQWCRDVSDFFYTRFPDRRFVFVNAGVGGDKAKECSLRLEEDVFSRKPDVVTVMFGMNDSNRYGGFVTNPTPRQVNMRNVALDDFWNALSGLSESMSRCLPDAKICWFTPTPYDEFARLDCPVRPGRGEALEKCAEIVRLHASSRGDRICELHAPMSGYNARERVENPSFETLCGTDRVHPGVEGGFFMAQAILNSWGAPSCVSDVTIDAGSGKCTAAENAIVSSVSVASRRISFDVLEKSLPMPVAKDAKSVAEKMSFAEKLNREYLRVKNLDLGDWTLSIDGNFVVTASAAQWSKGVNLSALPTPQSKQARKVSALNTRRIAAEKKVRRVAPARHFLRAHVKNVDDLEEVRRAVKSFEGQNGFPMRLLPEYVREWPLREGYLREAQKLEEEIYAANKPETHRYMLVHESRTTLVRNVPYDPTIGKFGVGDLYLSGKRDSAVPFVLCIHGGGWCSGNQRSWSGVAEFFSGELGFDVFNIRYRLAPENRWPACGDDCVKAAKFVLSDEFKKRYGLSYDKIWICGGSAGGHLTLWTLVNLSAKSVAGAISISAIGDPLPDFRLHRNRYVSLLGEVDDESLAGVSPVNLIKSGMAPVLCTHASRDGVVPIESHRAFADAYRAAGNRCEFFEYEKSAISGLAGHRIWIPSSKPHKLIPEIEDAIRKFVKTVHLASNVEPFKAAADEKKVWRCERSVEWCPVDMGNYPCVHGKSVRIPELEIVPGTALDLSDVVQRGDVDTNGRIISDAEGRLVFENKPDCSLRLRGFNCTYGGNHDEFQSATKKELEKLAEQFRLMGLNFIRLHFFDSKFVGLAGLKWWKYRNVFAEESLPQTKAEIDAIVDRDFLDKFHWFVKCLRDRGVYIMFDVATSPNKMMARARKSKMETRVNLFLDKKWRNHWKAAFDFWTQTVNPYTGTRFLDDPQIVGLTFCNEQDWIFFSDGDLALFTPAFRSEFGENMPVMSRRLLWEKGGHSNMARAFFRRRIKEMTDFYLGVVKSSGFKGLTTHWDMLKTPLGAEARVGLSAVAIHSYHAHPKFSVPLPEGIENVRAWDPWNKGKCIEIPQGSSITEKGRTYFADVALARIIGKPFLLTEFSHVPANDCAQEAPVVQAAVASLQDWQALCPHSDLIEFSHQAPYPFFDENINLMARISSVATAFGWQRGDISRASNAVSLSLTERLLSSPDLCSGFDKSYASLSFVLRIGSDAENLRNPLACLNVVPMRERNARVAELQANDIQTDAASSSIGNVCGQPYIHGKDVVRRLRELGVLSKCNRTDFYRGLFESETREIVTDIRNNTMTVDAHRFQAAALKPGKTARLSSLSVESVSTPASILAISLEKDKGVSCADKILLIVATRFMQEGAHLADIGNKTFFVDYGHTYTQLMKTGRFRFSIATDAKRIPKVYALRMNGTRAFEIPADLRDGRLMFDLDTSMFAVATPFFEIVNEK